MFETHFGAVSTMVLVYIALFWVLYYLFWPNHFHCKPLKWPTHEEEEDFARHEARNLRLDLESRGTRGVNIARIVQRRLARMIEGEIEDGEDTYISLLSLGTAENRRNSEEDLNNQFEGDHWPCDNRWLFMAIVQLLCSWLIALPLPFLLSFIIPPDTLHIAMEAGLALILGTALTTYVCYGTVKENQKWGVKRFGKQLDGYLGPGFNLTAFPWWEDVGEEPERIPHQSIVWGGEPKR